jgi:sec-independent protein translocase protein TatA
MRPSFVQIAIVILIIVIIFGAPKLPQLARSLGQSMKIFKSEVKDLRDDDETPKTTEPGALGQNTSADSAKATDDTTGSEASRQEKQDPQTHEK